jgi:hypothetical protein
MTQNNESLRECVQKIEGELRSIVGDCIGKWFSIPRYEFEELVELFNRRRELLDKMFVATSEEIERMEQVNNRLSDLTNKLFARTEELYHKMMISTYDSTFDNDVNVLGTLKVEMNDSESILPMSNDDYYGSDFELVFEIISCLYLHKYLRHEDIEFCFCYCLPNTYRADMSRDELVLADNLNDGQSWYHANMPAADNLSHLCICHAIYDLNMHKPYSIPDILRMNDFTVEVAVKHQHFANQFGRTNI